MTDRQKKILFAIFFVSFSIGMGYLLFIVFFRGQLPGVTQPTPTTTLTGSLPSSGPGTSSTGVTAQETGTLPGGQIPGATTETGLPVAASRVHLLHDGVTQAVTPSPSGGAARFYNPEDGRYYKVNADGSITLLSDRQFFNVQNVDWGNRTDQAIMEFPDGSKLLYDFTQQKQVDLPSHWSSFSFSPDDTQVAAKSMGVDPNNRFLIASKPDGTEARALASLGDNAALATTDWSPGGQIVGYAETGEPQGGDLQQQILFVGQHQENYTALVAPGADFLPLWSPTGKQVLFSVWSPASLGKPDLWVTSGDPGSIGAGRRNLNLQTWADKCAWASDTDIYCGIPQGLPQDAGLSRQDFVTLPDDVYHIDLKNGVSTKISTADETHPIRNPVISSDKTKLIFSDAQTGSLYSYDLK